MPTIYAGHQFKGVIAMALSSCTGGGYDGDILDGIQRMTYDYNKSISVIKECGNSYVYAFLPGVITVTGTIERAYTGSGMLSFIRGTPTETGSILVQNTFGDETTGPHIGFYPSGYASGQPYTVFAKCAFAGHRLTARPGNNLTTEVVDFYAKKMWTGSL